MALAQNPALTVTRPLHRRLLLSGRRVTQPKAIRLGQQDLKVVIARTNPVWRTVARCWRNGVVLVSEHYIESFRQEGQDADQKNQGRRITHACRRTASDGYEKIRLTATSLGQRLARLLGKFPTPRAHETPPESGALWFLQPRQRECEQFQRVL